MRQRILRLEAGIGREIRRAVQRLGHPPAGASAVNREATRTLKCCSGWPKINPSSDKNTSSAPAIDRLLVGESTYRDVQTFRLASAELFGFSSRLRNESGHNLWL